jgi:hypothetical protein
MPTFTFELPDGRKARLEAPDGDTAYRAFRQAMGTPDRTGPDVESGDEARAKAAGDTRSKMRLQDIEYGYDTAQARGDAPERKAMAEAYVRRENADSPIMTGVGDAVRQFAKGVPVLGGLTDEANAATGALSGLFTGDFNKQYEKGLDYQRARDSVYETANPLASTGLQIGGGVASGIGIARAVAPVLGGMSRLGALTTGATGGGVVGAVDGFTRGEEGVGNRLMSAGVGGLIGAGVGAAAPAIGKGISYGVNKVVDATLRSGALRGIGLTPASETVLTRALQSDDALTGQGARNIAAAGPGGMVVDAGPNTLQALDTAVARGGPGVNRARAAIDQRLGAAGNELTAALDTGLGTPQGVRSTTTGLASSTKTARGNAYDAAYNTPIDYSRPEAFQIEELLKTRVPKDAIDEANRLMRLKGEKSQQIMATIEPDGTVSYKTMPDVRQLDYIKRGLDAVAKQEDGKGGLGGQTVTGAAYKDLARELRDNLGKLVPEYGTALQTAADPLSKRTALDFGAKILRSTVARDEVAETVARMTGPEREYVRRGVRAQIDETLANVKRTVQDPEVDQRQAVQAIKDLSSDAAREKLRMIMGTQESDRMFAAIDQAAKAFELKAGLTQNSKTATRLMFNEAVKEATEPGPVGLLMEGRPLAAGKSALQSALGTGPKAQLAREDQIYDEVVRALTERRGTDAQRLLQELNTINNRRGQGQVQGARLGTLGAGILGGGAYAAGTNAANRR